VRILDETSHIGGGDLGAGVADGNDVARLEGLDMIAGDPDDDVADGDARGELCALDGGLDTVFSMLTTTPRLSPLLSAMPTPRISTALPSRSGDATMTQILVVPMSSPTMISLFISSSTL
jgi:hypothetical protein